MACHPRASELFSILNSYANPSGAVTATSEWLANSKKHIFAVLHSLDLDAEEFAIIERNVSVYPRLMVYTFAHVKFCSRDAPLLRTLKKVLSEWSEGDHWKRLLQHTVVKTTLCWVLGLGQEPRNKVSCNVKEHIQLLLDADMAYIAVHVQSILRGRGREMFSTLPEEETQLALNLLQTLLEFNQLDDRLRPRILNTLYTLSKKTALYPECLFIQGVNRQGRDAVAGGGFGDIWKGCVHGCVVAVKVMRMWEDSDIQKILKTFSREAVLWRQLSHPNIVPFYGISRLDDASPRICLVSPWVEGGNLVKYLEGHPGADRMPLLKDAICGLSYLHNHRPRIIHGDLKGANILVAYGRACLTDFGLSVIVHESMSPLSTSTHHKGGTTRWQAPELLDYKPKDPKTRTENGAAADVYAYGCVCYEALVGKPPFHDLKQDCQIMNAVLNGQRPVRPSAEEHASVGLDDAMWALMGRCWQELPANRPSADEIVTFLSAGSISPELDGPGWDCSIPAQIRSALQDVHSPDLLAKLDEAYRTSIQSSDGTLYAGDILARHAPFWREPHVSSSSPEPELESLFSDEGSDMGGSKPNNFESTKSETNGLRCQKNDASLQHGDPTISHLLCPKGQLPCMIQWDLRDSPNLSFLRSARVPRCLNSFERGEFAILPAVPKLTIKCPKFPYGWRIEVEHHEGLTIDAVLQGIHDALRQRVRQSEWRNLPPKLRESIALAFDSRCRDSEQERKEGVRRVDCLQEFGGLTWKTIDEGVCEMKLCPCVRTICIMGLYE